MKSLVIQHIQQVIIFFKLGLRTGNRASEHTDPICFAAATDNRHIHQSCLQLVLLPAELFAGLLLSPAGGITLDFPEVGHNLCHANAGYKETHH